MRLLLVFALVFAFGCRMGMLSPKPRAQAYARSFWKPTQTEMEHALRVAKEFARDELGLEDELLARMVVQPMGTYETGHRELTLAFFDPKYHEPLACGGYEYVRGGFPTFFTVSLDPDTWNVLDHYAERYQGSNNLLHQDGVAPTCEE